MFCMAFTCFLDLNSKTICVVNLSHALGIVRDYCMVCVMGCMGSPV